MTFTKGPAINLNYEEVLDLAKQLTPDEQVKLTKALVRKRLAVGDRRAAVGAKKRRKVSAKVRSLRGIISLPADFDHKKEYGAYLTKKYL